MSRLPYSIAWFLRFATDKENLTVLLNLRSLSFMANRSLFFITQHWFVLWRRWTGGCVLKICSSGFTCKDTAAPNQCQGRNLWSNSFELEIWSKCSYFKLNIRAGQVLIKHCAPNSLPLPVNSHHVLFVKRLPKFAKGNNSRKIKWIF